MIDNIIHGYLANEETYRHNSPILEEGSKGSWACIILEGRVKVKKRTSKGLVTIDTLKKGDIFGEMALFGSGIGLRTASVIADGDVKVGILDTDRLVKEYENLSPQLRSLLGSLTARLKDTTNQVISRVLENTQQSSAC